MVYPKSGKGGPRAVFIRCPVAEGSPRVTRWWVPPGRTLPEDGEGSADGREHHRDDGEDPHTVRGGPRPFAGLRQCAAGGPEGLSGTN